MDLFDWFANRRKSKTTPKAQPDREISDGLWSKCEACSTLTYTKDLSANQMVCPECDYHIRITSDERIRQLIDPGTWTAMDGNLVACDPLQFHDRKAYADRLRSIKIRRVCETLCKLG